MGRSGAEALSRLVAKHPALFRGELPRIASWLPTGWSDLADRLCDDIVGEAGELIGAVKVVQVKEKFGALRTVLQVDDDRASNLAARLRMLTDGAEEASRTICDVCGAAGTLVTGSGRVRVACSRHGGGDGAVDSGAR